MIEKGMAALAVTPEFTVNHRVDAEGSSSEEEGLGGVPKHRIADFPEGRQKHVNAREQKRREQ